MGRPARPKIKYFNRTEYNVCEHPPGTVNVGNFILGIMASQTRSNLAKKNFQHICDRNDTKCFLFFDTDNPPKWNSFTSVPLKVQSHHPGPTPAQCCPGGNETAYVQSRASTGTYFCEKHVQDTLIAQYRFLPSLHYMKSMLIRKFLSHQIDWMGLFDDDTQVDFEKLRYQLGRCGRGIPLYLGDTGWKTYGFEYPQTNSMGFLNFHESVRVKLSRKTRIFACGGSGSIFSRAAINRIDFLQCIKKYHSFCMQSDWMLGRCASKYDVISDPSFSCGVCGIASKCHEGGLSPDKNCVFAQHTGFCSSKRYSERNFTELRQDICTIMQDYAAVRHGTPSCCQTNCR